MPLDRTESCARRLDGEDPLARFREEFHVPTGIYLCGNSLGLAPKTARALVEEELEAWARLGVEGHFRGNHPWMPYHRLLREPMARVVGALPSEVVVMNSLGVNLHLLMASFYRPTAGRFKILIEAGAFPSDRYAVSSQASFHGFDPRDAVLECEDGDLFSCIEDEGESIALILIGNVNYATGRAFGVAAITEAGHAKGCRVGFDLAHGAGNLLLDLHDAGPDFAVWCSYKYLNGGPGAVAGAFVHERHARDRTLPRFAGWWGHDEATRFEMGREFRPMEGAEGWQLSNPPILQMAALRASLDVFDRAGMKALREKSERLTGYLEWLLEPLAPKGFRILTPRVKEERGAQLSLQIAGGRGREILARLSDEGVVCDFREPDILRLAPVPLYNRFLDVHRFVQVLEEVL
jgi:kynureninase